MPSITKQRNLSLLQKVIKEEAEVFAPLKPGEVVEGTVIEKGSKTMLVDLGRHGTGMVYGSEFLNAREITRDIEAGGPILGKVIDPDNEDGYVELSISEAGKQKAWDEVEELKEKEEVLEVTPSGFNKGGLIVDIKGLKAFLPLSQLSQEHYPKIDDGDKSKIIQELQRLAQEEFSVKIIDVNPKNNKFIISEKEVAEESAKELAGNYSVGQIIEGIISGVASFGAFLRFADNPAVEGLIHVSELDHKVVENPKEVVSVDDAVKAKIIAIKDGRIYLSLKTLKEDPWEGAHGEYAEGQEVSGVVYSFNPFGAVVTVGDLQGQVHVTEFGSVEEMRKQLEVGKEYTFVVGEVKLEEKRIYLKLKK